MELYIKSLSDRPYKMAAPDALSTPCLLLFMDRFEFNMRKMGELLASTACGFDFRSLWPHVKTHKSLWVTQQMMQAGIQSFKSTPNELDMLREARAKTIFIAYPLVPKEALRVARLVRENSEMQFIVQASHPNHVECLLDAAKEYDIQWHYFIDLDVGMHRTGTLPEKAFDFFRSLRGSGRFEFAGFHAYDGHNASPDLEERRKTSKASIDPLIKLFGKFDRENIRVPKLVMGGTPSFLTDLEYLARVNLDTEVILSPGTWIFFDTMYTAILPGTFDVAACILAQVMDLPQRVTATLNLGYKRWSIDQGPIEGFSVEGMRVLGWSEEHTVVSVPGGEELHVGDYVLIAPRHVCSTINLWEHFSIVGAGGETVLHDCPVNARNR
jgi:D-serine deaminase-like pyridoxal phosphate-dependent protein